MGEEVLPVTTFVEFRLVKVFSQQYVSARREQNFEVRFVESIRSNLDDNYLAIFWAFIPSYKAALLKKFGLVLIVNI